MTSLLTLGIIEGKYTINDEDNHISIRQRDAYSNFDHNIIVRVTKKENNFFIIDITDGLIAKNGIHYGFFTLQCSQKEAKHVIFTIAEEIIKKKYAQQAIGYYFTLEANRIPYLYSVNYPYVNEWKNIGKIKPKISGILT